MKNPIEDITPSTHDAIEIDASKLPPLNEYNYEEEVKKAHEEELNKKIAEFQKVKLDWDRMTPEEKAKAIEEGKHEPVLSDFTKTA
jgi:hypothetical protein